MIVNVTTAVSNSDPDPTADPSPGWIPAGTVHVSDSLADAPLWRREPYRLLFPLGVALAWAGVGHWLLYSLGVLENYRPVFHAMTQIQGFLMCFASGFLFTMIPRRTGSAPPEAWQMVVALAAPVVTASAAWEQHWMLAQAAWLVLAFTLIGFAIGRFTSATAKRRPPNSFVWIPAGLLMGIGGSLMAGVYGMLGMQYLWLHTLGLILITQGMFTAFILGVGGLAIPLMTRGEAPADGESTAHDLLVRTAHLAAAGLLIVGFVIEARGWPSSGRLLRAVVVLAELVFGVGLWRPPSLPGWNRRLIWAAAWMLPLGYFLAAVFPAQYKAGLHVAFIGGFALLALAVSTQVVLGHGNYRTQMEGRPWQVAVIGSLVGLAVIGRILVDFDRAHFFLWLGLAAGLFLAATGLWGAFLVPKLLPGRVSRTSQ